MKGKIIVIDGMDGTGKGTQSRLLYQNLYDKGHNVALYSFPNYKGESSYFVKKFLKEGYCRDIDNPALQSMFFAIDRGITFAKEIKEKYDQGYIIILDRYTTSNFIFHLQDYTEEERQKYYEMLYTLEMEYLKLPKPDLVIVLYSDPEVNNELMEERYKHDDSKRDLNENIEFQSTIYENILYLKDKKFDIFGPTFYFCIHNENKEMYTRHTTSQVIMCAIAGNILEAK